jgi:hypothetical protein
MTYIMAFLIDEKSAQPLVNIGWADWPTQDVIAVIGIVLAAAAMASALWGWTLRAWLTERRLITKFGADLYLPEDIANTTRYYVRPEAASVDLAQEMEEGGGAVATREDLFRAVDRFIDSESSHRHLLLLADSGMGKSSFTLNYYDYNRRKWRRRHMLAVIPLGYERALEKIKEIEKPKETVLFLDAFDEDPEARKDYEKRLDELLKACSEFKRVLITCRTQFFSKDDAIPTEARMVFAPRKGRAQHVFWRLYLAPFSDKHVDKFLRRRFWFWSFGKKRQARELIKKVPKLTVRPMLLASIPDLFKAEKPVTTTWDIYEIMTERWYLREEGFWKKKEDLKRFSEEVAVHLYLKFLEDGSDRVPRQSILKILEGLKLSIEDIDEWKATARSLLHRDAKGDWKFAHRSIMEFLIVRRFFEGDALCRGIAWTDQMKKFALESDVFNGHPLSVNSLSGLDLSGANLRGRNLSEADLKCANLSGADLREAVLPGANLFGADLHEADLRKADLTEAVIIGADITGAKLEGAILSGIKVSAEHHDNEHIRKELGPWRRPPTKKPLDYGPVTTSRMEISEFKREKLWENTEPRPGRVFKALQDGIARAREDRNKMKSEEASEQAKGESEKKSLPDAGTNIND